MKTQTSNFFASQVNGKKFLNKSSSLSRNFNKLQNCPRNVNGSKKRKKSTLKLKFKHLNFVVEVTVAQLVGLTKSIKEVRLNLSGFESQPRHKEVRKSQKYVRKSLKIIQRNVRQSKTYVRKSQAIIQNNIRKSQKYGRISKNNIQTNVRQSQRNEENQNTNVKKIIQKLKI